jgi:NADH-ubiquinone oxidoreductase chain 1
VPSQQLPLVSNYLSYYYSPVFSLFLSLLVWVLVPYFRGFISFELGLLFFLCCISLGVYAVIIAGWSSNSNYSLLGGLRSVAQTIIIIIIIIIIITTVLLLLLLHF